jgi:tetratricopeptide (TPR) repeat protein
MKFTGVISVGLMLAVLSGACSMISAYGAVASGDMSDSAGISVTPRDRLKSMLEEKFYLDDLESDKLEETLFIDELVGPEEVAFHQDQAIRIYRLSIDTFPKGLQAPAAQFKIGEVFFDRGEYEEATREYVRLIEKYSLWHDYRPSDYCDDAQFKLGVILMVQERWEEAIEAFFKLIDTYVDSNLAFKSYQRIAVCMEKNGDVEGAIAICDKLGRISDDPRIVADALLKKGQFRLAQDEHDSAFSDFNAALAILPESAQSDEAMFRIGEAYMKIEEYEQARIRFWRVVTSYELNPYLPEAYFQTARSYFLEKRYSQAVDAFSNLLARHIYSDKEHEIFKFLGECYENLYLYDKAIEVYKRIYEQRNVWLPSEEMVRIHYRIGECYARLGDDDKAEMILRQIAISEISEALAEKAAYQVGELLRNRGEFRKAIDANREALASFPQSELRYAALLSNSQCYRGEGEYPTALRLINTLIVSLKPQEHADLLTQSIMLKADIYYELDDYDNALPVYESLYLRDIDDNEKPRVIFRLARCREVAARFNRRWASSVTGEDGLTGYQLAEALYTEVINDFGDSAWASQARLNLESMQLARNSRERNLRNL